MIAKDGDNILMHDTVAYRVERLREDLS